MPVIRMTTLLPTRLSSSSLDAFIAATPRSHLEAIGDRPAHLLRARPTRGTHVGHMDRRTVNIRSTSLNIRSTTVEPTLSTCPSAPPSVSGWQAAMVLLAGACVGLFSRRSTIVYLKVGGGRWEHDTGPRATNYG